MFSTTRKRLTFTNVALTLVLVFVMTGGADGGKALCDQLDQADQSVAAKSVRKARWSAWQVRPARVGARSGLCWLWRLR
jgi:hypothetical protein